jgi:HD-like signal output (HDOD) protein
MAAAAVLYVKNRQTTQVKLAVEVAGIDRLRSLVAGAGGRIDPAGSASEFRATGSSTPSIRKATSCSCVSEWQGSSRFLPSDSAAPAAGLVIGRLG